MKTVKGWWGTTTDRKLPNGDNRQIRLGRTHKVKGEIIPCQHGLHLSKRIIDALQYSPGPIIYRVVGSGIIIPHGNPIDKYVCSERTYLTGGIDITDILRKFARLCALDVIHLWAAPDIVLQYLKTGNEDIRAAARDAAWDAGWAAACDAARDAARAAAWDAACDAARAAAMDAAWAVGWAAACDAACDAARAKQNTRLTRMVLRQIARRKETP